jgi:hypothetical protein
MQQPEVQVAAHFRWVAGQVKSQVVPLHVAVAPAGGGHGAQAAPQVAVAALLTHAPLQECWPPGQPEPLAPVSPPAPAAPPVPPEATVPAVPFTAGVLPPEPPGEATPPMESVALSAPPSMPIGAPPVPPTEPVPAPPNDTPPLPEMGPSTVDRASAETSNCPASVRPWPGTYLVGVEQPKDRSRIRRPAPNSDTSRALRAGPQQGLPAFCPNIKHASSAPRADGRLDLPASSRRRSIPEVRKPPWRWCSRTVTTRFPGCYPTDHGANRCCGRVRI